MSKASGRRFTARTQLLLWPLLALIAPVLARAADSSERSAVAFPPTRAALLEFLLAQANDLERPAIALAPVIADVLAVLRNCVGCKVARMSGSGATCFALYASAGAAQKAAKALRGKFPNWWIRATVL